VSSEASNGEEEIVLKSVSIIAIMKKPMKRNNEIEAKPVVAKSGNLKISMSSKSKLKRSWYHPVKRRRMLTSNRKWNISNNEEMKAIEIEKTNNISVKWRSEEMVKRSMYQYQISKNGEAMWRSKKIITISEILKAKLILSVKSIDRKSKRKAVMAENR